MKIYSCHQMKPLIKLSVNEINLTYYQTQSVNCEKVGRNKQLLNQQITFFNSSNLIKLTQ